MIRLNTIPTVVAIEDYWGGAISGTTSVEKSTVLGITTAQPHVGEFTPETYTNLVNIAPISASTVSGSGLNLFAPIGASGSSIAGSGLLEHYKIAGVALSNAPFQGNYVTWGFSGSTQEVGYYESTYGGVDYFGNLRRVAMRRKGLLWIKYEGASEPVVGHYVQPSAVSDGYATLCPSGSASININYGKVYGFASGTNLGGITSSGTVIPGMYVLVHFTRGNW